MLIKFSTRTKKISGMTIKVNGRCFNADFCEQFTETQLREIYKHEDVATLDVLVKSVNVRKEKKEVNDGNGSSIEGKRVSGRKPKG